MAAKEKSEFNESDHQNQEEKVNQTSIRLELTVDPNQEPIRIDKFIQSKIENITRNRVQQGIADGHVLVNNCIVKNNYKVKPGDLITVMDTRSQVNSGEIIPEDIPLDIVYEDNAIMVINKSANMVVHPGNGNRDGTLVHAIAFHLRKEAPNKDLPTRVGLVHRIDKDTTGLLVIAKTEEALIHLQRQFKKRTTHRKYVALVWGDMAEDSGTINCNIGRDDRYRKKMDVYPDSEKGKVAVTHWRVLERFFYTTLLEFQLETGRTHQIRVHTKWIGHPLFNDATYGGDRIVKGTIHGKYKQFVENNFKLITRQALHAKELGFLHPATQQYLQFDSPLPDDMLAVIDRWRKYADTIKDNLKP